MKPARADQSGFTILEIMIATAILTLGLVGILALFPVAIHYGKQIIEKSSAVVVAESVAEAIREGLRNNLRSVTKGNATHHYFVFRHDGVKDPMPRRIEDERPDKDFYILLPRFRSGKEGTFTSRERAGSVARTFVYPETDPNPNGNGDAFLADDDGDDFQTRLSSGEVNFDVFVEKTYELGAFLPAEDAEGDTVLLDQRNETLKQYSFAFEIQSSQYDTNLEPLGRAFQPANKLYRVRVLVFRGFRPPQPGAPPVLPIFQLDFEVAK
jgi:prepilin-type N-terminal cleavage/methylation domain-containing protein